MRKDYYGTKRITAWPQQDGFGSEGYAVQYPDGYTSWSPKAVFEEAYKPVDAMDFSHALQAVKDGHRVARKGWNGKGMFIFLVNGSRFTVNREPLLSIMGEGTEVAYHAHVDMKTADGQVVPWLCSQTDMLAEDWQIVEVESQQLAA